MKNLQTAWLSMNLKIVAFGCLWITLAGCTKVPEGSVEVANRVIEARDAFYDGVKLGENTVIVVGKFGKILRSDDNGKNWIAASSGVDRPLLSISFRDDTHGAIVGTEGIYLESQDSGLTWTSRSLGADSNLLSIRFINASLGFILGEFGTLLRTETGGRDWRQLELNWEQIFHELWETLGPIQPHLYDIAFCDSRYGWIVGEYGLILFSQDRGLTWQKQRGGGLFDRHLFTVGCVGSSHVVAAGQGGEILYTADSGDRWSLAQSPVTHDIYDVISLPQKDEVLALGDLATVLMSADGGSPSSWREFFGTSSEESNNMPVPSWIAKGVLSPPDVLMAGQSGVHRIPLNELTREKG